MVRRSVNSQLRETKRQCYDYTEIPHWRSKRVHIIELTQYQHIGETPEVRIDLIDLMDLIDIMDLIYIIDLIDIMNIIDIMDLIDITDLIDIMDLIDK